MYPSQRGHNRSSGQQLYGYPALTIHINVRQDTAMADAFISYSDINGQSIRTKNFRDLRHLRGDSVLCQIRKCMSPT